MQLAGRQGARWTSKEWFLRTSRREKLAEIVSIVPTVDDAGHHMC
jgi:hypothetical protein